MTATEDYVLGVHDAEIARLGVQHRAWRAKTLSLWRRAGLRAGARALDFGCGPGYATFDLAEIIGPDGHVLAVDRSRAFLDALAGEAARRGHGQIEVREEELTARGLRLGPADFAWARWIFAFTPDLDAALDNFAGAVAPGGAAAITEYIEYGTWRFLPPEPAQERFCRVVMESWRARGGEPNVAGRVMEGLTARGFDIVSVTPELDVVGPEDPFWDWPETFVRGNTPRLVELGDLTAEEGAAILSGWDAAKARPGVRMVTPLTAMIVVRKRP